MTPVAHIGLGNVETAAVSSGASVTITKPANTTDGDLLVAFVNSHVSGATWSVVPAGWVAPPGGTYNTNRTTGVWARPVPSAAEETASTYTWTVSGSGTGTGRMGGLIVRITGADLDNPWDAIGAWQASLTATGITTTRPDCLLLCAAWAYTPSPPAPALTPAPGMSGVGGWQAAPAASTTHLLAAESHPTAGATGARTATADPGANAGLSVLAAIAAPVTGSADLAQASALTATPLDIPEGEAALAQASVLTAAGTVPDPDLTGQAHLAQGAALVVADPGQPRILSAGVWRPYLSRRLVGGTWITE